MFLAPIASCIKLLGDDKELWNLLKLKKVVKAQNLSVIVCHPTVCMSDVSRGNEFNESAFNYQTCNVGRT